MAEEKPTVEEPKVETDDAAKLMEELSKLDIKTPEDVQNMAFASQEAGKAWNEVGALRKEVSRLTELSNTPPPVDDYSGESVDLGKVVEDKVQGVLNRYLQGQQQAQQAAMMAMSEVRQDEDYHIVGPVFEKHINTPEMVMRLQNGQADYVKEYNKVSTKYYKNLAQRTSQYVEKFTSTQKPPHMEQGESQTAPLTNRDTEKTEKLKSIKKAQKEGSVDSDKALEDIIKSVMPDIDQDPSFYTP